MKKTIFVVLATAFFAIAAVATTITKFKSLSGMKPAHQAPASTELPVFYAYMTNNMAWQGQSWNPEYGIYSITGGDNAKFSRVWPTSSRILSEDGGFYYNEKYYYVTSAYSAGVVTGTLHELDAETFKTLRTMTSRDAYAADITFDYTTGYAYGVGQSIYGSYHPLTSAELKRIDLSTGEFSTVGVCDARLYAIAADAQGELWAIGNGLDTDSKTYLFKIDKETGEAEKQAIINKNVYGASPTSMTFDLRNGKLYWVALTYVDNQSYERTFDSGLFEIDTTTGVATKVINFDTQQTFASLYIKDSDAMAPQAPANLAFKFAAGSTNSGSVTFTVPTLTYCGTPLSGPLTAEITIDGQTTTATSLTPGSQYTSASVTLAEGSNHEIKVVCLSGDKRSVPARISVYAGVDAPAAVTGLTVKAENPYEKATVSWTAPTVGVNGGYIDTDAMTYTVTRKPDNVVVAKNIKTTTFVDEPDRSMGITQYEVKSVIDGVESAPAYTSTLLVGKPYTFPYLETFDTYTRFLTYTVIDANNDSDMTNGGTWYYDDQSQSAFFFTNSAAADDWLVTPTLAFSSDMVYRVQFQTCGYMGNCQGHFVVTVGNDATAKAQKQVIMEETYNSEPYFVTCYSTFRPAPGDNRIAIHNVSDGSDHMIVDNIVITEYGTIGIPSKVLNLKASKSEGKVKLSFTAPTLTVGGDAITSLSSIKIARAGSSTALGEIKNPTPGHGLEWIDEAPVSGYNHYVVLAVNSEGEGIEDDCSITTYCDIPQAVRNIKVEPKNGYAEAEITWEQPLVGVKGELIDQADITYDIYRYIGVYRSLVAENVTGLSVVDRGLESALSDCRQQQVKYEIEPKTNGGNGAKAESQSLLLGRSYEVPFAETWADQKYSTYTWTTLNSSGSGSWGVAGTGYDPYTQGQDGYGLMTFSISRGSSSGRLDLMSPRIDVSTYTDLEMSFYVFKSNASACSNATIQAGVYTDAKGIQMVTPVVKVYDQTSGWSKVTMTIPDDYAESDRLALVFRAYTSNSAGCVHIDNVTLTGRPTAHEIKAEQLIGPERAIIGKENVYYVDVRNLGTEPSSNIVVDLYADGDKVGTKTVESLNAGSTSQVSFGYTPSLDNTERQITVRAEVTADPDRSPDNNTLESVVDLVAPMLPMVIDLTGRDLGGNPMLQWSDDTAYPHVEYVTDDVEGQKAFAITDFDGWTTIDRDGAMTAKLSLDGTSVVLWDNAGEPQAWIAYNTDMVGTGSFIRPRSGNQCFISFEATVANSTSASGNDDWLVSPMLSGDEQMLTFYAKALYPLQLNEQFEVWVSESSNTDVTKFTRISGQRPIVVDNADAWTKYTFTIPAGSRYFAIRCVSVHQFGLMVDDITYSPVHESLEFWGYNVYRNGELITADAIGDTSYADASVDLTDGKEYRYNVTALYDGGESVFSNSVYVSLGAGIDGTVADASGVKIVPVGGGVSITGAAAGRVITVHSVSGALISAIRSTGSDIVPLAPGIYVVTAGVTSAKVIINNK